MTCTVVSASSSFTCLRELNFSMSQFSLSLKTDYVFAMIHMLAIVFSGPFWHKVTKGLLLSSLSSSIPCFTLPCSDPVVCSFVALRGLPDLKFQTSVNFTKSEICLAYAFLP